ncbi:MAG TPA: L-threonylcarbamoyladenylate synthase [Candidatus Limnocylindrales bacterium]
MRGETMTARVVRDDEAGIAAAIDVLRAGGVVGLPTDTVYGIAVALDTPGGVGRLFAVKERPPDRAIVAIVDSIDQLAGVVDIPAEARVLAAACWPGGLTIVLPLRDGADVPASLTAGARTLGVRIPDHATPRALAAAVGPLPTTSANPHGEPAATDAQAVSAVLGARLDLVLDGGPARGGVASTVVDCSSGPPRLLRAGAISADALAAVLDDAELPHGFGAG